MVQEGVRDPVLLAEETWTVITLSSMDGNQLQYILCLPSQSKVAKFVPSCFLGINALRRV